MLFHTDVDCVFLVLAFCVFFGFLIVADADFALVFVFVAFAAFVAFAVSAVFDVCVFFPFVFRTLMFSSDLLIHCPKDESDTDNSEAAEFVVVPCNNCMARLFFSSIPR